MDASRADKTTPTVIYSRWARPSIPSNSGTIVSHKTRQSATKNHSVHLSYNQIAYQEPAGSPLLNPVCRLACCAERRSLNAKGDQLPKKIDQTLR
jgi:hypothetical protein